MTGLSLSTIARRIRAGELAEGALGIPRDAGALMSRPI
jgi:hypothetical protein